MMRDARRASPFRSRTAPTCAHAARLRGAPVGPSWFRRGALRLAPVLLGVAALAGLAAWARTTPGFAVAEVRVQGCGDPAREARLVERAGLLGSNLLAADLDAARARVAKDPWVAEAVLRRVPPRTVVLRVAERTAVAWHASGDGAALLDGEGLVLETADAARPDGLPVVEGPEAARAALARTLAALRAASPDLAARTRSLHALQDGSLRLVAAGEPDLLLAGPASVDEVLGWLETSRSLRETRGPARRVDARYEGRLFVLLQGTKNQRTHP